MSCADSILSNCNTQQKEPYLSVKELNALLSASENKNLQSMKADQILGIGRNVVYRVEKNGRYYALKVTKPEHGLNERAVNEKVYESHSPYFLRMHQAYQEDDDLILMPLAEPLDKHPEYVSDEKTVIHLGQSICEALRILESDDSALWEPEPEGENRPEQWEPMLHLDIKPGNIFVRPASNGENIEFQLGDFGSARPAHGGQFPSSASEGFCAPEVLAQDAEKAKEKFNIDPNRLFKLSCQPEFSADIFSLGMTLYWCLCQNENLVSDRWKERCYGSALPKPENCSEKLWYVIDIATATVPIVRYQSAEEMLIALRDILPRQNEELQNDLAEVVQQRNMAGGLAALEAVVLAGTVVYQAASKIRNRFRPADWHKYTWEQFGGTYYGAWADGVPDGKGVYTFSTKKRIETDEWIWVEEAELSTSEGSAAFYTGMVKDNKPCGIGRIRREDNSYEGEWLDGIPYGCGCSSDTAGASYCGCWKDGTLSGKGSFTLSDGTVITGKWSWVEKKVKIGNHKGTYVGTACDGRISGEGAFEVPRAFTYRGEWLNGFPQGRGSLTDVDGNVAEGLWKAGALIEEP